MANVMKDNFNTLQFEKFIKSPMVPPHIASILRLSWKNPEEYAKKVKSFVGWRIMSDLSAFCFVVATYVAAAKAIDKFESHELYDTEGLKTALGASKNKTQYFFNALISPENLMESQIGIQEQDGFKDVFVELLKLFGVKDTQAKSIYNKFKTKLKGMTNWVIYRGDDMNAVGGNINKVLDSLFQSSVISGAKKELADSGASVAFDESDASGGYDADTDDDSKPTTKAKSPKSHKSH
ncbi:MAG: hypothetical protein IKE41_03300, partial [Clostridia bacterium]|nr:hypothetical protein [Clostridia bacterium]MBR2735159.1 hypothetical protein [Clostridia bacterium]